jgi:hypothetical protein
VYDRIAIPAAKQRGHGLSSGLAQQIPAGDVDRRFHIGMALQRSVHQPVERAEFQRIGPDQVRAQLPQPRAHPLCVGRKVGRAERTHLAMANQAFIGFDAYDRTVEHLHGLAASPVIAAFPQRQINLKGQKPRDLHVCFRSNVADRRMKPRLLNSHTVRNPPSTGRITPVT